MPQIDQALPTPYAFDPATTALILIDLQRDFLEPDGFSASLGRRLAISLRSHRRRPPLSHRSPRLPRVAVLIFGSMTTEVCVQTTMREANDRGYTCLLIEDATDGYFPEFKAVILATIRAQGAIIGWTATAAQLDAALTPPPAETATPMSTQA